MCVFAYLIRYTQILSSVSKISTENIQLHMKGSKSSDCQRKKKFQIYCETNRSINQLAVFFFFMIVIIMEENNPKGQNRGNICKPRHKVNSPEFVFEFGRNMIDELDLATTLHFRTCCSYTRYRVPTAKPKSRTHFKRHNRK